MDAKIKPLFGKHIFWDVNYELIDYDAKANFVIERVFQRPLVIIWNKLFACFGTPVF